MMAEESLIGWVGCGLRVNNECEDKEGKWGEGVWPVD